MKPAELSHPSAAKAGCEIASEVDGRAEPIMQRDSKSAIVKRLQFAVAELEVISGIAEWERDADLLAQLHTLIEQVRECITFVLNRQPASRPPTA